MNELTHRRECLKEKFQRRESIFGAWTSLGHPSITEILVKSGVDFIGIDIEHSTINQEQCQRIMAASQANRSLCLARVASHNPEMTRRLCDSGVDGIIFPTVSSVDDVVKFVTWMKYPPLGQRGYGIARAQGYGFHFEEYTQRWNQNSILIVQIESIKAVERAEEIIVHPDIDGVMIGPYDISGSLGVAGQLNHPQVIGASQRVVELCKKYGKSCGTQIVEPDQEQITLAMNTGYTFVILASDIFILWKWAERMKDFITTFRKSVKHYEQC